eukprot:205424-Pelagomonas_calceolata.AAC.3
MLLDRLLNASPGPLPLCLKPSRTPTAAEQNPRPPIKRTLQSMGTKRVTSRSPRLILVVRDEERLLKSASGSSKLISVLDKMKMKLQNKLGGFLSVSSTLLVLKTKLFKGLQIVRGINDPAHLTEWYGGS